MDMPYRACRCICGSIWAYIGCSRGVARDVFGVGDKSHQGGRRPAALCRRYKLGTGNTGYTPDTSDAPQIHPISTPGYTLNTTQIHPGYTWYWESTGRSKVPSPPPRSINGVSRDVYGVYLGCIRGVSSVDTIPNNNYLIARPCFQAPIDCPTVFRIFLFLCKKLQVHLVERSDFF